MYLKRGSQKKDVGGVTSSIYKGLEITTQKAFSILAMNSIILLKRYTLVILRKNWTI